jgi:hypothetical protein
MSEHCGKVTHHVKKRGRIRRCEWCGQQIKAGERYAKWLYFDGGSRSTVYAHDECSKAWEAEAAEAHDFVYAGGDYPRPTKAVDIPLAPAQECAMMRGDG